MYRRITPSPSQKNKKRKPKFNSWGYTKSPFLHLLSPTLNPKSQKREEEEEQEEEGGQQERRSKTPS